MLSTKHFIVHQPKKKNFPLFPMESLRKEQSPSESATCSGEVLQDREQEAKPCLLQLDLKLTTSVSDGGLNQELNLIDSFKTDVGKIGLVFSLKNNL